MENVLHSNAFTRTKYTVLMALVFFAVVAAGHLYLIIGISVLQICAFKEILRNVESENRVRLTKSLSWYLFLVAMYYLHGENLNYYFSHVAPNGAAIAAVTVGYHRFLSLLLYLASFVFLVTTARTVDVANQVEQFVLSHVAVLYMVLPGHFAVQTMLEGLIWFLLPAVLVVINDCTAYGCGKLFGRTQLLKLSPKKTVEGFLGAWLCTIIGGMAVVYLLRPHTYFTCPADDLGAALWSGLTCSETPMFYPQLYYSASLDFGVQIAPIYIHTVVLATFSSLLAPFGGFFASAVKRSLMVKDFGSMIPGHGGVVDRIDCQLFMMLIACMYCKAFVFSTGNASKAVVQAALSRLSTQDQLDIATIALGSLHRSGIPLEAILQRVNMLG